MSKEEFFLEGKKCFLSQKYDEAIKLFEQALALDQNYIDAYNYMARSFQESGKSDKAAECYYQEGEIWYNLGNYEEASLAYNRVIVFDDKRTDVYRKQVDTLSLLIENYNKEGNERSFAEGIDFYGKANSCYFRLINLPKNANVDISKKKKITQVIFDIAKKYYTESKSLYSLDKNTSFEYYVDAIKLYKDITKISNEAHEEYSTIWGRDADLILELAQDYINKGDALYTYNKYDARKYYDKAIEFYQEVNKVEINKLENSKEYYDKLIFFSLNNAKHFHEKGDVLYKNKQTGDSHYQYKIAVNLYEQFIHYKKDEKIDHDIVQAQLSIYVHLGEEDKINNIIYNSDISSEMKAEAYYQKALINYKEAKSNESLAKAKSSFEKVIKINQNYAEAYCMLGYISHRLGNKDNALIMFEKALGINSVLDIALNGKGVALLYLERHEEALQYFQEALMVNPKLDVAHYNLGILNYELTQDIEIALINFQEAIDINPTALYHCHRAQIYYATGRIKEALEDFNKAARLADLDQYGSNLTMENKKDIIKYLWHERIVLLK